MHDADEIAALILADLLADFKARGLSAASLGEDYIGISFDTLRRRHAQDSPVDFDLAVAALEKREEIRTGPMVPFENDPHSALAIFCLYSKREHASLTEAGYRQTQNSVRAKATSQTVHISGSTLVNSQIGLGEHVAQSLSINVENDGEVVRYLLELAQKNTPAAAVAEQDVEAMVGHAKHGDLASAKPLFHKLFGVASEGAKQIAWTVISAIIARQMGLSQ